MLLLANEIHTSIPESRIVNGIVEVATHILKGNVNTGLLILSKLSLPEKQEQELIELARDARHALRDGDWDEYEKVWKGK